ncbi:peptide ABC transporter substrate-binding protein [Acidiphilium acidophilum]|uniref:Peptide ABC transporter substrate-binding protein n=1 Tax=Acidiphilium acidophilum TaxID=76588 RepID=A0AAW9DQD5_ACIAO|nr:peptide ABC transporter substrate-binding protein [Acidiphilium acidophilum]MDX5930945.1 peptide ABC transporter substrate-binding protein [Acidiphilium acidophilum]
MTMRPAHVQTGTNNRFTRLRRCLLAAALSLPLPALAAAPQACGTVIVPPGVGLGTPPASVTSLNPFLISSAYNGEASSLMYYGLLYINRDHKIVWPRSLATKIDVSKNNTVFTVTMKPWKWSDGRPVTTRDVKFTYDLIKRLGPTYPGYNSGGVPNLIKSFDILGPETFSVTLKHPVNPDWFELLGLAQFVPYPAHAWGKYTINQMWRHQSDPAFFKVVDGPYQLVKFKLGRFIEFAPNPTYQGHKSQIRRFIMTFLHSSGSEIEGMQSGTLDVSNLPFSLWNAVAKLKDVRRIKMTPNFGFQFIQLNYKNPAVPFFHDVRVRQAMADAINQEQVVHVLFHDASKPEYGPIPVIPSTFLPPSEKAGKYPIGYDPAKARKLLDEAGWKPGPDGIREKNGKKLAFTLLTPSGGTTSTLWTEIQQQDLRAVGIDMKIRQVTFNQLMALDYRPLTWEAMAFGWSLGSFPSDAAQLGSKGSYNQEGYNDKKMDELLAAVTTTPGLSALYAYEKYAVEQQPIIFQNDTGVVVLARKGLRGIRKFISPTGGWSPQYLHWTTPDCASQVADNVAPSSP